MNYLSTPLNHTWMRRYVVKLEPWLYVGQDREVTCSQREARKFESVDQAHTFMRGRSPRCCSVVPATRDRAETGRKRRVA